MAAAASRRASTGGAAEPVVLAAVLIRWRRLASRSGLAQTLLRRHQSPLLAVAAVAAGSVEGTEQAAAGEAAPARKVPTTPHLMLETSSPTPRPLEITAVDRHRLQVAHRLLYLTAQRQDRNSAAIARAAAAMAVAAKAAAAITPMALWMVEPAAAAVAAAAATNSKRRRRLPPPWCVSLLAPRRSPLRF